MGLGVYSLFNLHSLPGHSHTVLSTIYTLLKNKLLSLDQICVKDRAYIPFAQLTFLFHSSKDLSSIILNPLFFPSVSSSLLSHIGMQTCFFLHFLSKQMTPLFAHLFTQANSRNHLAFFLFLHSSNSNNYPVLFILSPH